MRTDVARAIEELPPPSRYCGVCRGLLFGDPIVAVWRLPDGALGVDYLCGECCSWARRIVHGPPLGPRNHALME